MAREFMVAREARCSQAVLLFEIHALRGDCLLGSL